MDVTMCKVMMNNLFDTPDMDGMIAQCENFDRSDQLLLRVSFLCQKRGFKFYRHSVGPTVRDFRVILMCGLYQSIRCPFTMTFKRPDIPGAAFMLIRYRSEHNHPLYDSGITFSEKVARTGAFLLNRDFSTFRSTSGTRIDSTYEVIGRNS